MSSTFCVMPFYGAEFNHQGYITPCCLLEDQNILKIQQDMLNGVRSKACNKCWVLEDRGLISDRILKNQALDFYENMDIKEIEKACHSKNHSKKIIKFN